MRHLMMGRPFLVSSVFLMLLASRPARAAPREVAFAQSATTVEAYDFVDVTLKMDAPDPSALRIAGIRGRGGNYLWAKITLICEIRLEPNGPSNARGRVSNWHVAMASYSLPHGLFGAVDARVKNTPGARQWAF